MFTFAYRTSLVWFRMKCFTATSIFLCLCPLAGSPSWPEPGQIEYSQDVNTDPNGEKYPVLTWTLPVDRHMQGDSGRILPMYGYRRHWEVRELIWLHHRQ
jgi:hypothetical protein